MEHVMSNETFTKEVAKIESSLLKVLTTKSVVYLRILNVMGDLTAAEAYLLLTDDLKAAIRPSSFSVTISRTKTLQSACRKAGFDTKAMLEEHRGLDGARKALGLDVAKVAKTPDMVVKVLKMIGTMTLDEQAAVLLALESTPEIMAAAARLVEVSTLKDMVAA